jgi:uncharacterized membrane protein
MRPPIRNPWFVLATAGGLVYPLLVYFGMSRLPPGIIVLFGLGLISLRLLGTWRADRQSAGIGAAALALAGIGLLVLLRVAPSQAALAYPVVVSLATAMIFGLSLIRPPSVIERIVRIREPDLPVQGVIYARQVTMAWTIFLIANAMVSAGIALRGNIETWTLWNGLISYLLMGVLFIGEMGVRRVVRRRHAALT